jgi:hypothetical protein
MSDKRPDARGQPLHQWLPSVLLKFLVFLAFAFVLYEATVGLGDRDLGRSRTWVVIAGMFGLLLLLAVDRLTELRVSPRGVEATLFQAQAEALQEIGAMEDPDVVQAAQAQVLQAESPEQVERALATAVELNVLAQAKALQEIGAMEDPDVAEAAQAQVLQAESPEQVERALATAVELKRRSN